MNKTAGVVFDIETGKRLAPILKYPLLVKSYQQQGHQAVAVVYSEAELAAKLATLVLVSRDMPLEFNCLQQSH